MCKDALSSSGNDYAGLWNYVLFKFELKGAKQSEDFKQEEIQ